METIEITTNLDELNKKIKAVEKAVKELNDFKFKGILKKDKGIIEYSTNLEELNERTALLKKLIKEINNFKIKTTTKKIKPT